MKKPKQKSVNRIIVDLGKEVEILDKAISILEKERDKKNKEIKRILRLTKSSKENKE